jgi:hypothetical protein
VFVADEYSEKELTQNRTHNWKSSLYFSVLTESCPNPEHAALSL